ncbi:MAG: T9SS type A sorting domain-containing protein [Flavobacteriales bacterium]
MKYLSIISLLWFSVSSYSQSIQKQVIGSFGGISSGGNYEIDCTVGEAVIDTFSSGSILLYQGFHHATDSNRNTSLAKLTPLTLDFVLFPNPTSDKATLRLTGATKSAQLTIQVFTVAGKLVSTSALELATSATSEALIDIGNESAGVYFVRIADAKSGYSKSLRLVKQ